MTVVAIDVGGSKMVGAVYAADGPRHRVRVATPLVGNDRDPGSTALRELAEHLVTMAGDGLCGVGISFCEYVDGGRLTSRDVIAWREQPADWMAALTGAPVVVESDVRAGALAEATIGALRGIRTGFYVSWGTGLSSSVVVDGTPLHGRRGRAIAWGELPAPEGQSLEAYASGSGMARRYAARSGRPTRDAREVLVLAQGGDEVAVDVARTAGQALAEALRTVTHLLDPDVVVLGGGLGAAATAAREALFERSEELDLPPVTTSTCGEHGALLGAALVGGWQPS